MYETVKEGKAVIRIKKAEKISKEMEVFYNPIMKLNRDVTILLLQQFPPMNLCDPLAASGIRSIRFAKELKHKSIVINDVSKKAINLIKNNLKLNNIKNFTIIKDSIKKINNDLKLNKINTINKLSNVIKNKKIIKNNKKIMIFNEDANLFLLNSNGFDYIDLDPWGSSNPYLEAAIKRISRNGILAVTNTDTAALTGTYPKTCIRKYWSMPKRDYMMHETGLRILIRKIQLVGMQYEKALFPIFSYFKGHYFRIFFQCIKGKKLCDEIAAKHGMFDYAGPLWLGSLWDSKLVNKMYASLLKNYNEKTNNNKNLMINDKSNNEKNENSINNISIGSNKKISIKDKIIINNNQNNNELIKFLKIIREESKINVVGFYDIHDIAKKRKLKTMMKKEGLIKEIKKKGFKAADTHFSGTGLRSDISYNKLVLLLKE